MYISSQSPAYDEFADLRFHREPDRSSWCSTAPHIARGTCGMAVVWLEPRLYVEPAYDKVSFNPFPIPPLGLGLGIMVSVNAFRSGNGGPS